MPDRASRLSVALIVAAVLAAPACGSAAKSTGSAPAPTHAHTNAAAPRLTPVELAQRHVAAMVLAAGSLPGYTVHSKGPETLKDQMPPKGTRHGAEIRRLVKAAWLASAHSFTVGPDGKLYVFSDANLFRSSVAAARMDRLERQAQPGTHERFLPAAAGGPAGGLLVFARGGKLSAYTLSWVQGPVIAYVRIYGHPHETVSRAGERRIATFLATAANAQAVRIAHVEALGDRVT